MSSWQGTMDVASLDPRVFLLQQVWVSCWSKMPSLGVYKCQRWVCPGHLDLIILFQGALHAFTGRLLCRNTVLLGLRFWMCLLYGSIRVWSGASCPTSLTWFARGESGSWYKYYLLVADLLLCLHALTPGLGISLVRVLETHFLGPNGRVGPKVTQVGLMVYVGRVVFETWTDVFFSLQAGRGGGSFSAQRYTCATAFLMSCDTS